MAIPGRGALLLYLRAAIAVSVDTLLMPALLLLMPLCASTALAPILLRHVTAPHTALNSEPAISGPKIMLASPRPASVPEKKPGLPYRLVARARTLRLLNHPPALQYLTATSRPSPKSWPATLLSLLPPLRHTLLVTLPQLLPLSPTLLLLSPRFPNCHLHLPTVPAALRCRTPPTAQSLLPNPPHLILAPTLQSLPSPPNFHPPRAMTFHTLHSRPHTLLFPHLPPLALRPTPPHLSFSSS